MTRKRSPVPRWLAWGLVAVVGAELGVAGAAIGLQRLRADRAEERRVDAAAPLRAADTAPSVDADASRRAAISDLLARRAYAIRHRDRAAFDSTLASGAFAATQGTLYESLAGLSFSTWSYLVTAVDATGVTATLTYALDGFDADPVTRTQRFRITDRADAAGGLALAGLAAEPRDLWDLGPVHAVRHGDVLVIGRDGSRLVQTAREAGLATAAVDDVGLAPWDRRVVVLVPGDQRELAALIDVDDADELDHIVALAGGESIGFGSGRSHVVGNRVLLNPVNYRTLSAAGRSVVLAHEVTHVMARTLGGSVPKWLGEGFADWVGYRRSGLPVRAVAAELRTEVAAGRIPSRLPDEADFAPANPRLAAAYEGSWLACRLVVDLRGTGALLDLYRLVASGTSVEDALRTTVGVGEAEFVRRWRAYLRSQLG